jgi:transcriptional regulator with XRE-family HTH domain
MPIFHERLKALREEAKLTFEDISYLLNCSEQNYQEMESGSVEPAFSQAILLAKLFSVSLDYLAGNANERKCGE